MNEIACRCEELPASRGATKQSPLDENEEIASVVALVSIRAEEHRSTQPPSATLSQRHDSEWIMAVGKQYCVYIMTNAHNTVLYTGVTNVLARRVYEHRHGLGGIFTKKYNIQKLVYYEIGNDVNVVIAREKQIKGGSRKKKIELINSLNPTWKDLYEEIME